MAENLNGKEYNWEEAKTACPTSWHLPSWNEWQTLIKSIGNKHELWTTFMQGGVALRNASTQT